LLKFFIAAGVFSKYWSHAGVKKGSEGVNLRQNTKILNPHDSNIHQILSHINVRTKQKGDNNFALF
jgi:hypothetical protein